VGVSHHPGYPGESGHFLRRTLGVAAGNHNPCIRVFAMDAADGGAGILIGGGSDGTGVEHNNVSFQS